MKTRYSFGGDEHIFVECDEEMSLEAFFKSMSITNAVRAARIEGITEICPANGSFQIKFDPEKVSLEKVVNYFWDIHDPTTLNRQGNDIGTQYRSGIYTHNAQQADTAHQFMAELERRQVFGAPLVTEVAPVRNYHPAEAYHQRYAAHHPHQGYCAYVVAPKVAHFRDRFQDRLKPD